jgi:hypothetical protein
MMEGDNTVENGARAYFWRTVRPGPDGAVTNFGAPFRRMGTQRDRADTQALENGGSSQPETAELGEFCQRGGWPLRLWDGRAATRPRDGEFDVVAENGRCSPAVPQPARDVTWPTDSREKSVIA